MPIIEDKTGITKSFGNRDANVIVENPPVGLDESQKLQMIEFLKTKGISGLVQFKDVDSAMTGEVEGFSKLTDQAALEAANPPEPETTPSGVGGAIVREAGGPLAATLVGAGLGSVVPGVGTVAGAGVGLAGYGITKFISPVVKALVEKLGGTAMDVEELENAVADSLNIPEADTPTERIAGAATRGVVEAGEVLSGAGLVKKVGKLVKAGTTLLNPIRMKIADVLETTGQIIADIPVKEFLGSLGASGGSQSGIEIAKANEWGTTATTLMSLGSGILGSITMMGFANMVDLTENIIKANKTSLPEAAEEAMRVSYGRGDVRFVDIAPSNQKMADVQDWMKTVPGGSRSTQIPLNKARQEAIKDFATDAGVTTDAYYSREMTEDFWNKRKGIVGELKGRRVEIYDRLSQGRTPEVKVGNTVEAIDKEIAHYIGLGNSEYKPITDNLDSWRQAIQSGDSLFLRAEAKKVAGLDLEGMNTVGDKLLNWANAIDEGRIPAHVERDLVALGTMGSNSYTPLINKLMDWRGEVQGKNLNQLEETRATWGNAFKTPEFANLQANGDKAYLNVYGALRDEMGEHIMNTGTRGDYVSWQTAGVQLKNMAEEYNTGTLKSFLNNKGADPSLIQKFIRDEDKEIVQTLYGQLTPFGQNRMRASIASDIVKEATVTGNILTPNIFADSLREKGAQKGILMSHDDTNSIEGTLRWLEQTWGAEKPLPVGSGLPGKGVPGSRYAWARLMFGNPALGIPLLVGGGLSMGRIAQAIDKPPLRDLMIKYGELPERQLATDVGAELVKRITEVLKGYATTTEEETPERETGAQK